MRRTGISPVVLVGALFALACGSGPDVRAAYLQSVTSAERPLEEAWFRFDAAATRFDWPAAQEEASRASAAAAAARDFLERLFVPPSLTVARREELLFLSHVFLAYQGFAGGAANTIELAKLRSILRRGRIHQRRGRDSLR